MQWDDTLREKIIESQYRHLETKAEIVQYYQQSYPGKGKGNRGLAWKQALVADVLREKGITPENTDAKEYKRQQKNVGKRFEKQRLTTPEPKNKADYKAVGKKLPPVPPKDINYTVRVYGEIRISRSCKSVSFKVTIGVPSDFSLQGPNAANFTDDPDVYSLVLAYWHGDDPGYDGWCEGPYFEIIG